MTDRIFVRVSETGHAYPDFNVHRTSDQITLKTDQNVLSGKWPPQTQREINMLKEQKRKNGK